MEIKTLELGLIKTNCYLLSTEKAAVIIDPGFNSPAVTRFLIDNLKKQTAILLTHAHFDHIGAANELRSIANSPVAIGEDDADALTDPSVNLSQRFHAKVEPFKADILLKNGQIFTVGDIEIKVISTPGHTKGGVSYLTDGKLFSGDTLFFEAVGRTDFPGGNIKSLQDSVERLYELPDSTEVFPGHGPKTTIGHEKSYNPFVRFQV